MFKKIKNALFPQSPPTEQEQINERNRKIGEQLEKRGPFGLTNHAHEWYGYTWKEIFADYFGYYHWQGQYFIWREQTYDGEAVSLLEMGHGFAIYFRDMKKATTQYPTPEESAFMEASKPLWEQVIPTFGHMSTQQAIELFFGHCLGPDTPLMQQENYNLSSPFEQTYLFHTGRARCTSVEEARRLDQAYYEVFKATMAKKFIRNNGEALKVNAEKKGEADFIRYMDHPYAPVLDGTLDAVIPLPGVEEKLTLPDHAIIDAKIELIVLNYLLADKYAVLREYLGMKGTRLSDYEVGTKAYAVSAELDVYAKFVKEVRFSAEAFSRSDDEERPTPELSVDWAFCWTIAILDDIKAIFDDPANDYRREKSWEEVPRNYRSKEYYSGEESIPEQMKKYSAWLKENRNEMERIFAQFAHATGVKPAAPVEAISKPVKAEATQEGVIEALTLSDEPISLEMTVDEARVFLKFGDTEKVTLEALYTRYKDATAANDSKTIQEEIDTAYQVLIAYLEKQVAYQQEKTIFGFGLTETITVKELDFRYERASTKTDSKAEQKALDEAYQVLLKIAV